jgi:hypothetical protein
MAIGALVGIAVAAIAVAVVVLARNSGTRTIAGTAHWSSWAPDTTGSTGVSEIAQHVAPYYRFSPAQQLDVVTPVSLSQATASGTTTGRGPLVVLNAGGSTKSQSLRILGGNTVAYSICGLGAKDCELAGTPSTSRMLLLRREALELALYTLRYISGTQNVLAVLPPGHTVKPAGSSSSAAPSPVTVAVLFDRNELQPWLNVPLRRTLQQYPPEVAQLSAWSQTLEAGFVDQVTAHALFASQVESSPVGSNLLVLNQLPAQ